jgi:hypothetical protein
MTACPFGKNAMHPNTSTVRIAEDVTFIGVEFGKMQPPCREQNLFVNLVPKIVLR